MEKPKQKLKLGELLMGAGMISKAQLEEVLAEQAKSRKRMGQIFIERNILTEDEIMDTLAVQLSLQRIDIRKAFIDPEIARSIPEEVAKKYNLIPFFEKNNKLYVAMSDPLNIFAIDDISFITHKPIQPCIASFEAIEKAIELYFSKQSTDKALEDLKKEYKVELDEKLDQAIIDEVQSAPAVRLINSILNQAITREGIVLLTGPTGSGKSTTLYTILKELNTAAKNIVTVEDPIEYTLLGINQVQVNTKAGLTFASSLRSILRQDPDIIMIGEMRDEETAHIAVRAAITGHLVFSTLHTNDAPSSLTRLVDMGVAPYLVAEAVVGIISQRLLRKLCPSCKQGYLTIL